MLNERLKVTHNSAISNCDPFRSNLEGKYFTGNQVCRRFRKAGEDCEDYATKGILAN